MGKNKIRMPASEGGLVRYDDEVRSKIVLNPWYVVGFVIAVVIFGIILSTL